MIKRLLILGAFCSLSFGGIEDDITKDKNSGNKLESMKKYIDNADEECRKIKFQEHSNKEYSLSELEQFYESSQNINNDIRNLDGKFRLEINQFLLEFKNDSTSYSIAKDILGETYHHLDADSIICHTIDDIEQYKQNIKKHYAEVKIKQIIKNEMFNWDKYHNHSTTIEDYDKALENAHSLYEKLRQLSAPYEIDTYQYKIDYEERYINELKDYRQRKIEAIEREAQSKQQNNEYAEKAKQNDKAKKASIPKYKNWKNITVPKFQKSLKAGDSVAGGIVWKVDGNLVVVDTGNRGLASQRRDQTYPRVPQDLIPLFMDEITGVAKY